MTPSTKSTTQCTNILINGRDFAKQAGGTKVYWENMLRALDIELASHSDLKIYVLTTTKVKTHYQHIQVVKTRIVHPILFDFVEVARAALQTKATIIVGTKCITPPLPWVKKISVIYDMGHFHNQGYYSLSEQIRMRSIIRLGRLYTDHYITISKSTQQEMIKFLKLKKKLISVITPGSEHITAQKPKRLPQLPKKYILFTGNNSKRKNLDRVIEAYKQSDSKLPLLITGFPYGQKDNQARIKSTNTIKHLGYVSEAQLKYLYQHAYLYIYTSLFEGFGIPILEAQSESVPVITSNKSSMPEAAGKGALLVDPYSVEEIAKAIQKLETDTRLRSELIKAGLKNASTFQWQTSAQKLIDLCTHR